MHAGYVRADLVAGIVPAWQEHGFPVEQLLRRARVSVAQVPWLRAPAAARRYQRVPRDVWLALVAAAIPRAGATLELALRAAGHLPRLDQLGDWGHLIATASTLGDALRLVGSTLAALSDCCSWTGHAARDAYVLTFEVAGRPSAASRLVQQVVLLHMATVVIPSLCEAAVPELVLELPYQQGRGVASASPRVSSGQLAIAYGAPRAALHVPRALLAAPQRLANEAMHQRFRELLSSLHGPRASGPPLVHRVRSAIDDHGRESLPRVTSVARSLGLSTRSLQRALAEEGTCFSDELERHRRAVADYSVRWTSCSMKELSARLGFSSAGAFTRAYRRWYGESPSDVRRDAQTVGRS